MDTSETAVAEVALRDCFYLYSVVATLVGGDDVFFEAAAMLTTFSLAGHWLEMRSRFATLQFTNWQWLSAILAAPVVAYGAWPFHKAA